MFYLYYECVSNQFGIIEVCGLIDGIVFYQFESIKRQRDEVIMNNIYFMFQAYKSSRKKLKIRSN
jgi:hypothetical protein